MAERAKRAAAPGRAPPEAQLAAGAAGGPAERRRRPPPVETVTPVISTGTERDDFESSGEAASAVAMVDEMNVALVMPRVPHRAWSPALVGAKLVP